jgi:SAM-dependent methyltransferase
MQMSAPRIDRPPLKVAYEPELIPPPELMRLEGLDVLEEWFRWAEEWSMLLRIYGRITRESAVLEIGCGLGRIAFPLRYVLSSRGTYDGFEICEPKVRFLTDRFTRMYPNFRFRWADIKNTYYNLHGTVNARSYDFEYGDASFDVVFGASVFTHALPSVTSRYFHETRRVLKPGGRAVFSFFLLDNYKPGRKRPLGFGIDAFNFDHSFEGYGEQFAIVNVENPEEMTAYRTDFLRSMADDAGLVVLEGPLPGLWSAASPTWVGAQDVLVLGRPA